MRVRIRKRRSSGSMCARDQPVDEADHGRLAGAFAQPGKVELGNLSRALAACVQPLVVRLRVQAAERLFNLARRRDLDHDSATRR
jgi:hypothetical protein